MSDLAAPARGTSSDEQSPRPRRREPVARRRTTRSWFSLGAGALGLVLILAVPLYLEATWLRVGEYAMVGAVAAIGLTLLTGHCGQLSLGTPFFMLVGASAYATLAGESDSDLWGLGLPPVLALLGAVAVSSLAGLAFAPVAGRVSGIYLSVATLSLVYIGLFLGQRFSQLTGGAVSGRPAPDFTIAGLSLTSNEGDLVVLGVPMGAQERMWYLFVAFTIVSAVLALGAVGSRPGRAWRAVRDNPASAAAMGVHVARARASAFAVSSGFAGLAGVMTTLWFGIMKADENEFDGSWSIGIAIAVLAMVIIGGLGSVGGAVAGAIFVFGFPLALQLLVPNVPALASLTQGEAGFTPAVLTAFAYGGLIVLVVIFEPGGLAAIGRRLRHHLGAR